jgi:hypothetical protein
MTSVPKPLKFLRPHYADLQAVFANFTAGANKVRDRIPQFMPALTIRL